MSEIKEQSVDLDSKGFFRVYDRYRGKISAPDEWTRRQFEARIRGGFSGIDNLEPTVDRLQRLVNYSQALDGRFALLQEPSGLSLVLAKNYLDRIPSGDLKAEFNHMILRLRNETSYLDELEDVGVASALLTGLEKGKYGAWVKFLAPDSPLAKTMLIEEDSLASYMSWLDIAFIYGRPPSVAEMWLPLVDEGKLPDKLSHLDHELTHDAQFTRTQRALRFIPEAVKIGLCQAILFRYGPWPTIAFVVATHKLVRKLGKAASNETIVGEIQAYEASASNPAFFQEDSDEEREITFSVVNDYGERGKHFSEMVKAKKAFDSIRTLRILGLNDREIGRVVSRARFNGKECTYPKLEKKIMEERKKWGIEDEETFRKVVGALLARQELELYVQRHHAQRIATEQLEIASGKKGWLKR